MRLSEYRQTAKDRLNGQWGINVGLVVIVGLLTGAISNVSTMTDNTNIQLGISFLLGILVLFAFSYSLYYVSLYVVRGGRAELGQIFCCFSAGLLCSIDDYQYSFPNCTICFGSDLFIPLLPQAGSSVYVSLISTGGLTTNTESVSTLMNIGVLGLYVISTLLFLLVTTIISIIFKFAVWVKFDYPDLSVGDCIKRAWILLKDRWGKYILLQLSFIGWYILGFVALIVGLLFVAVYVNTASAFYDQALKEKIDQGELA